MGFLIGIIIGVAGGGYLAYRYRATIEAWLSDMED